MWLHRINAAAAGIVGHLCATGCWRGSTMAAALARSGGNGAGAVRAAVPQDGLGDILFVDHGKMTADRRVFCHPTGCPTM